MGIFARLWDWISSLFGGNTPQPEPPPPPPPPPPDPIPDPVPPPPDPVDPIEEIKQRLLEIHNRERTSRGYAAYNRVAELDASAQLHNDYMVRTGNLTHNEPGANIGTRISRQGYQWSWAGENIAYGQRTAEEVMKDWMNSSGHRSNILSRNYKDVGFGVTKSGNTWWWTANFGARR